VEHDAQLVPIDSIKPFRGNARTHDLDVIRESLRVNGQYRPIVVRLKTREVLAGNGTLEAAIAEGWTDIWVTFIDVDAKTSRRIVLVDNRSNDLAGYDNDALGKLLDGIPTLEGTGYTEIEQSKLVSFMASEPGPVTPPKPGPESRSQLGDTWELGEHRLTVGEPASEGDELIGCWESLTGLEARLADRPDRSDT
jgi:ParB-like chromosome segregation protein Spo0J